MDSCEYCYLLHSIQTMQTLSGIHVDTDGSIRIPIFRFNCRWILTVSGASGGSSSSSWTRPWSQVWLNSSTTVSSLMNPCSGAITISILTIGITERFKVLGHEPGQHLLAERHIRQGLEGRLQCGRCQQGGEVDGGACGQGYQVNDYCSTKIFSYASSSTLYPCQSLAGWAEFRTSVAPRLASLF